MKKISFILLMIGTMLLSACSFLNEVNESLDYVNIATDHINTLNDFAETAPQLIEEAIINPEVAKELEGQLLTLKNEIEQFIALNDIPAIAKDIHDELVKKNEQLLDEINKVLENGHLVLDQLESSQLFTTINNMTTLLNRIENLGL